MRVFKGTARKWLTLATPPLSPPPPPSHKPPMWSQCAVVVGALSLSEPELNSNITHCAAHCTAPYMIGIRWKGHKWQRYNAKRELTFTPPLYLLFFSPPTAVFLFPLRCAIGIRCDKAQTGKGTTGYNILAECFTLFHIDFFIVFASSHSFPMTCNIFILFSLGGWGSCR